MIDEHELQQLREEIQQLRQRLDETSRKLERLSQPPAPPPAIQPVAIPPPVISQPRPWMTPPPVVSQPPPIPAAPKESFEVRLGTYWLPRIGIAVLLTGMVFFAAYITPRLGVAHKVALGYFTCLVLGVLGVWLEKKTLQFARVLQGGALALAYFVTYAAHFVEAFRVIHSPTLAIAMLSVVVLFIVGVAQEKQSPTLGGMALFFGYYTSVASGVAIFTLASNAVLALAAIFFLARNRWVHISYGAVLATYLTYMIWVWKLTGWGDLDNLIFRSAYLNPDDFFHRGIFLSLYWLVFTLGGLIVNRDAMNAPERNGLVTLNNMFFFMLFSLLMHHAYPDRQWQFQFCFGGALLIVSALAYQRFAPERAVMDALFLQGLLVATLGLMSYFQGVRLVAALALESAFLLVLARWMSSRWIAWIGRATFAVAAVYAWSRYDDWDAPMRYGVWFAAAVGFLCARMEKRADDAPVINYSAFYFAMVATVLAMAAASDQFTGRQMPWVWVLGAVAVALVGGALRTREITWAAHLPLAWAHGAFCSAHLENSEWALAPSLALIAVTFAFGIVVWGRGRAQGDETRATNLLVPYVFFAMLVVLLTTFDHVPKQWRLAVFAAETLTLIVAAALANERTFAWASLASLLIGTLGYLTARRSLFADLPVAWSNLCIAALFLIVAERVCNRRGPLPTLSVWLVAAVAAVTLFGLRRLVSGPLVTVGWAGLGFVLLAFGFAIKQRSYRMAGLTVLGFSLLRAVFHDMARVETVYRILSFIGLGVILLVLAFLYAKNRDKLAKWL